MIKNFNIFTALIILAVFTLTMRIIDISNFSTKTSVAQTAKSSAKKPELVSLEPPPMEQAKKIIDKTKDQKVPESYGVHTYSKTEVDVLQTLSKRREKLDKIEKTIAKREALLKAAETEVDRKIAELSKIKSELENLLNSQKTIQEDRVKSLVKIYEGMKPKQAATIFNTLEMDILLAVMGRMSERKTSPILANMSPDKARKVTIKLAKQHQLPEINKP